MAVLVAKWSQIPVVCSLIRKQSVAFMEHDALFVDRKIVSFHMKSSSNDIGKNDWVGFEIIWDLHPFVECE